MTKAQREHIEAEIGCAVGMLGIVSANDTVTRVIFAVFFAIATVSRWVSYKHIQAEKSEVTQ